MAVFQFSDRILPYEIEFAPFAHDLVLLQGSRFNPDYWTPVLENLREFEPSSGRIITAEWAAPGKSVTDLAQVFGRLMETLGLRAVYVVAMDDAAEMIGEVQRLHQGLIEQTLLFPQGGPKGENLARAVHEFCGL